ncbi:MAG: GspH/FimT family pseudopilin [Pseudomonadota bacterium]
MPTSRIDQETQPDAGLTLLEVLAAVTIAMLLLLALPGLGGGPGPHEQAVRLVVSTLSEARAAAIAERHPVRVIFNLESRQLERRAEPLGIGGPIPEPAVAALPEEVDLIVDSATLVAAGPNRPAIVFLPDGSASGGQITLVTGERRDTVRVRWLTGALSRLDGSETDW